MAIFNSYVKLPEGRKFVIFSDLFILGVLTFLIVTLVQEMFSRLFPEYFQSISRLFPDYFPDFNG